MGLNKGLAETEALADRTARKLNEMDMFARGTDMSDG